MLYSHRALIDANIGLDPLKALTKPAMQCLVHDEMYEITIELFTDLLANYSSFLDGEDFQMLTTLFTSSWSSERYNRLIQGDFDFDALQFGQFMIAFGDAIMNDMAKEPENLQAQQFLDGLEGLLSAHGSIFTEDKIFVPALEFWTSFVEYLTDALYDAGSEDLQWMDNSRKHVVQAIRRCWQKIQFPPASEFLSWDAVERTGFTDARKDVLDLIEASHIVLGSDLLSMLASLVDESLRNEAWSSLEASLFCLGALGDCVSQGNPDDGVLGGIFGSSVFETLADPTKNISVRTRQTSVNLFRTYATYFEHHPEYLPSALSFLFRTLQTPSLAGTASLSIASLCSCCRQSLASQLDVFFQQYENLTTMNTADGTTKERVIGAIAAIAQALPTDHEKQSVITRLLQFITTDVDMCQQYAVLVRPEEAEQVGLTSIRCLLSVAKGLQALNDVTIDLEADEITSSYWIEGAGRSVQASIINLIERTIQALPLNGEVVDTACTIFRAGFAETNPGPFVFSSVLVTNFLLQASPQTPRTGAILSTACALISSHTSQSTGRIDGQLGALFTWVSGFMDGMSSTHASHTTP